jgi:hypothetical protein
MPISVTDITTISIDTVYQRVLALANKEQRGYITPQEFNLHANQAQLDIFEQYFYDLAAMTALKTRSEQSQTAGANVEMAPDFGDTVNIIREKLSIYKHTTDVSLTVDATNMCYRLPLLQAGLYRTGRMYYSGTNGSSIPIKRIDKSDLEAITELFAAKSNSRWHTNDTAEILYTENTDGSYSLYSEGDGTNAPITSADKLKVEVIEGAPAPVKWAYVVVNEKALYDSNNSVHFNLHRSEETNLVIKILELAGITINKPGLVQIATNEESQNTQQTK